jgi:hypothetical protein
MFTKISDRAGIVKEDLGSTQGVLDQVYDDVDNLATPWWLGKRAAQGTCRLPKPHQSRRGRTWQLPRFSFPALNP